MKQVLACALRGKKPAALEGQGLPQSQAGSGWSLLSRPLCAENIWVGLVLSMETGQVVPTTSRSSCPQRFLSDYGLQWVGEPMDQEDSEEKIASENDERDWMTAKKFWKPGTVDHLPWPPSATPCWPATIPEALCFKPWPLSIGVEMGLLSYQHLAPDPGKARGLPPWSPSGLYLLICQGLQRPRLTRYLMLFVLFCF